MIVRKILNNNLLLASDENGREQIVMGNENSIHYSRF